MTYLQLLEQLRSRDDDFRRSRVDQAVLEAHRNIPIRQESTVPPYARKNIDDNILTYYGRWKDWADNYQKRLRRGEEPPHPPMPKEPAGIESSTLGIRRDNEIRLQDEPRLRSQANEKWSDFSKERLTTHELRHKALNDMGISHQVVDHHDYIGAMQDPIRPPKKYDWMTDPKESDEEKDKWTRYYERSLRKNARKNYYLDLLKRMGYEY